MSAARLLRTLIDGVVDPSRPDSTGQGDRPRGFFDIARLQSALRALAGHIWWESKFAPSDHTVIRMGVSGTTVKHVEIELNNESDETPLAPIVVRLYMAQDETGRPSDKPCASGVMVLRGHPIFNDGSDLTWEIVADEGYIELRFNHSGGAGPYTDRIAMVLPSGRVIVSDPLWVVPS